MNVVFVVPLTAITMYPGIVVEDPPHPSTLPKSLKKSRLHLVRGALDLALGTNIVTGHVQGTGTGESAGHAQRIATEGHDRRIEGTDDDHAPEIKRKRGKDGELPIPYGTGRIELQSNLT